MTSRRLPWLALVLVPLATACGDDEGGDASGGGSGASSYGSVAELAEDLTGAGLACTLEYEGLRDDRREVSLCTLEGELAELSVWDDPADAAANADQADEDGNPLAAGSNWTIDVQSSDTAGAVADALDGTVRGA